MKSTKSLFVFAISLLSFFLASAQSSIVDTTRIGNNDRAGHFVTFRGINMYYETYGQGQPLLMIHGNGGSISNFIYQVPYFATRYKVIVADSRAQGRTRDAGDSLSYEMMADDFDALLTTLHLDSCYVIGWSDGGINGLLLAIRHPAKVKKLAITGANLWPDTSAVDPLVHQWAFRYNESLQKVEQTPEIKNTRKVAHLLSYAPHIPVEQLQKISCPTLVIAGDHDVILTKHTLLIANSIPKSYLWIIPGSGHSTPIDHKDEFNEAVDHFFSTPYKPIEGLDRFN